MTSKTLVLHRNWFQFIYYITFTTLSVKHMAVITFPLRSVLFEQQQEQDPTNLYISNLPLSVDEKELENMLQPFGQVVSTRVLRDYSGNSRGVGFARSVKGELEKESLISVWLNLVTHLCNKWDSKAHVKKAVNQLKFAILTMKRLTKISLFFN